MGEELCAGVLREEECEEEVEVCINWVGVEVGELAVEGVGSGVAGGSGLVG